MLKDLIIAMLWSVSPLGEAKVGIPYGMLQGANIYLVFLGCFLANLMVFPIVIFFLNTFNRYFLQWEPYKKTAFYIARRTKTNTGANITKYGFWGLLIFVMIPLPGTGVYAGSIATYLFQIEKRKAFMANAIGIFLSSVIIWVTTLLTMKGLA